MTELELALSAYRANPTQENHDLLSAWQSVEWYRSQVCAALEEVWDRG